MTNRKTMGWRSKDMAPFDFETIYLDEQAEKDWPVQALLRNLPHVPVERVGDKRSLIKRFLELPDSLETGKRNLFVTRFLGRRLKPCPGTSSHLCCGYYVINAITNCPMDCSYCVLQGYLNNPFLTLYSNWEDLLPEIDMFLSGHPHTLHRLGTGELSDSLALDPVFPLSEFLVPYFSDRKNAILELKTKSTHVDRLFSLNHRERTVVSWSLTPASMIEEEERRTASLDARIAAAKECQERGYLLGFHFDPIIHHEHWEKKYQETVLSLFSRIDPKRVVWISLGGFRYPQRLKAIARGRFPETKIFLGELFPGRDAKFRYLKEVRVELYRKMVTWLQEVDPNLFIYLCMESKEVWNDVYGWSPANNLHLNHLFEQRLEKVWNG